MHANNRILSCAILLCCSSYVFGTTVIPGNQSNPSFSFAIGPFAFGTSRTGVTFFAGTGENDGMGNANTSGDYTISRLEYAAPEFTALSPEKIKLNNVADTDNPFRNKTIAQMSVLTQAGALGNDTFAPIFFTVADNKTMYLIDRKFSDGTVNVISNLNMIVDGDKVLETGGLLALTGASSGAIFAALLANGETAFGEGNSAISLFGVSDSIESNGQTFKGPFLIQEQNATTVLNFASDVIQIGNPVTAINNAIDLHWDSRINRLFIGLQVTGNTAGTDGARSVVVGRLTKTSTTPSTLQLEFSPIAPATALTSNNKIIGATEANTVVSAFKVRTMHTSSAQESNARTGLSYLIVNGDVGSATATPRRRVYALPIVCTGDADIKGTLAKQNSTIVNTITTQAHPVVNERCFNEPATIAADLLTRTSAAARVGGDDVNGDIKEMQVVGDTVFVSVQTAATDLNPGVFFSRAILDKNGAIVAWTNWQHFNNVTESAFGFFTDYFMGNINYFTTTTNTSDTFKRSGWGSGSATMSAQLLSALANFPADEGGVQGFFNFPTNTPAVSGSKGEIGMIVTTGNQKIIMGQTGNDLSGTFVPTTDNVVGNVVSFENGTVTSIPPVGTKVVEFTGGVLDDIGAITAAEITYPTSATIKGFLFVGGIDGLAVLINSNGRSWDGDAGLDDHFDALIVGATFKTVGNYTFIQKLFADGDYLYVVTPTKVDRIDINNSNFATGALVVTTVADITQMPNELNANSVFLDFIASNKLALLATSFGLYRVGNGKDIQTAISPTDAGWTQVSLPFSAGPVFALQPVSTDNLARSFANNNPGNVYVLTTDLGNNRARISRLAIQDVSGGAISDDTVQHINDMYQNDVPQYFLNPGKLVQSFYNDGAINLLGRNRNQSVNPVVYSPAISNLPINYGPLSNILHIGINSANGSRIIATDNGIFTDE